MCDSCESTPSAPVSFPGVPFVLMLCQTCVRAGVIPYDVLVSMVWLGNIGIDSPTAQNIALYHGNSITQFEFDCANYADKMLEIFDE